MSTVIQLLDQVAEQRDAFVERFLKAAAGMFEILSVYIGHRVGYYKALDKGNWLTSGDLANLTNTYERYAREWLEQQTVAGIVEVEDESAVAASRRYRLPEGHREVLVDHSSLNYLTPLVQMLVGTTRPLDQLIDAYRTGTGVPYTAYGRDFLEGQAGMNRPMFLQLLGTEWLPTMPEVHRRLQAHPPARIADVGCGAGWSCIGIALAYPNVRVDGFDIDAASIRLAQDNVAEKGLADRISFFTRDASDHELHGRYDVVTAFECVHDMSDPVGALRTMRHLAGERGTVLVGDERVGERFTARGTDFEWMMYGWSILHCLPVGMAPQPSAETGTVMRVETLTRYAREAGFRSVEVLPIDHFFFRFYRLQQ
jgi:2-polyprenyl-3-methyl-5-hydroxy-6-metoxy-1,4-benzoquinol methylase